MNAFDGTTLEHANWREFDGRLLFVDQQIDAGPVSYLPFLERSGRVGYQVEADGASEFLILEPSPNRNAQKAMVVHAEDSEEVMIGLVDIDLGWTFREMPYGQDPLRLDGGADAISATHWLQVAAAGDVPVRINFDGLGVPAGDYRYVPFLDAAGRVGHQVLGPDRESVFLYMIAADAGLDQTISVNAGKSLTQEDPVLAAYEMANWLQDERKPGMERRNA